MAESPATLFKWHVEAPSVEIRRGINLKKFVEEVQEREGRDILSESVQGGDAPSESWRSVLCRLDSDLEDWEDARAHASSTNDCSVMVTYVDDMALDAEARRRKTAWTIILLIFSAGDPKTSEVFLSLPENTHIHFADLATPP